MQRHEKPRKCAVACKSADATPNYLCNAVPELYAVLQWGREEPIAACNRPNANCEWAE